jgi:hypothetical protein
MGQRDRHEHVQITLTTLIAPTGRNRFEHVGQLANLRRLICKIRPLARSSTNMIRNVSRRPAALERPAGPPRSSASQPRAIGAAVSAPNRSSVRRLSARPHNAARILSSRAASSGAFGREARAGTNRDHGQPHSTEVGATPPRHPLGRMVDAPVGAPRYDSCEIAMGSSSSTDSSTSLVPCSRCSEIVASCPAASGISRSLVGT